MSTIDRVRASDEVLTRFEINESAGSSSASSALFVAYLLYMMIRKRKGERPGIDGPRAGALTPTVGRRPEVGDGLRQVRAVAASRLQFATPAGRRRQWAVLPGVPVGIIALYFLKLRRRPVQVPSTLLWRRSLEDLHVNSLFQRLRRNLLLFLQLLAVLLAMLALAGPRIKGTVGQGERYVLAIDNSASMSATDVAPTRLDEGQGGGEEGRRRDGVGRPGDGHRVLRPGPGRLELHGQPQPAAPADRRDRADRGDDLAPRGAPGRRRAGQPLEADRRGGRRHVGRHAQAEDLHRRRLPRRRGVQPGQPRARGRRDRRRRPPPSPEGADAAAKAEARAKPPSNNVAILALQTRRNEEKPDIYQVFGRVHNYRAEDVETEAQLFRHDPDKPGDAGRP